MYRYVDVAGAHRLVAELRAAAAELERARRAVHAAASVLVVGVQRRLAEAAEWAEATAADLQRRVALLAPPDVLPLPAGTVSRPSAQAASAHDSWYRRLVPEHLRSGAAAARFIIAGLAPARTSDADDPVLTAAPAFAAHRARLAAVRDAWERREAELTARVASGRLTADELRRRRADGGHDGVLLARAGRLTVHQVYAVLSALPAAEREIAMQELGSWAAGADRRDLDRVDRELLRGALAAVRQCHVDVGANGAAIGSRGDDTAAVRALGFPRASEPLERTSAALAAATLGRLAPEGYDEPPEVRAARHLGATLGGRLTGRIGGAAPAVRGAVEAADAALDGDWSEVGWAVAGAVPLTRLPDRVAADPATLDQVRSRALELRHGRAAAEDVSRDDPGPTGRVVDAGSCLPPPHASAAAASGDLEDHPAGLEPPAQQRTEGGGGGEHPRPVR